MDAHVTTENKSGKVIGLFADLMLENDDVIEFRTYRRVGSGKARILCIDVNGVTILRVGGLKAVPEIVQE